MEKIESISSIFKKLKNIYNSKVQYKLSPTWNIPNISNDEHNIGSKIKHIRRKYNIKQSELASAIGYNVQSIRTIENYDIKLINTDLLIKIIKELEKYEKIDINDEYISFIINDPCKKIRDIRKSLNLSRQEFANKINTSITSVRRWENGSNNISRKMYERLKKCMS